MKNGIRISGKDLARLAARITPAYEARNTIPVLATAQLQWGKGTISLSLTNLDMQIDTWTEADTFGEGRAQISFPTLMWLCRSAGIQMVEMEFSTEDGIHRVDVTAGPLSARLNLLSNPEDYPSMRMPGMPGSLTASQADLARVISKGRRCISTEETRYYLNGSYLHPTDGQKLRAVSTDGHRLARIESDIDWPKDTPGIIMPTSAIDALMHLMDRKANAPVTVSISATHFRAEAGDWCLRGKVIDGTFPDYTRVIPVAEPVAHITVNHACLRPLLVAPTGYGSHALKLDTAAKTASLKSVDSGFDAAVGIEASGKEMQVGFNRLYMCDLARSEGTLRLALTSPGDPARIYVEDPAALFVLMPMRI